MQVGAGVKIELKMTSLAGSWAAISPCSSVIFSCVIHSSYEKEQFCLGSASDNVLCVNRAILYCEICLLDSWNKVLMCTVLWCSLLSSALGLLIQVILIHYVKADGRCYFFNLTTFFAVSDILG